MIAKYKSFIFIMLAFAITQLSTTLILPALPQLVTVLQSNVKAIMFLLSIFFFGYAFGQLTWGNLSDHFGRRPMMLISLALYTLISFALMFLQNLYLFYMVYALLGFQAAAYTSVGNAILKDLHGKNVGIYMSIIGLVMATGAFLGPLLGGNLLHYLGWQILFGFLSLLGLLALVGFSLFVPESHKVHEQPKKHSSKTALKYVFTNYQYLAFILVLGLSFGTYFAYLDASPFIFENYLKLSTTAYTWIFPIIAFAFFAGAMIVTAFIKKVAPYKLVYIGFISSLLGGLVMVGFAVLHIHNTWLVLISSFIMLFGLGTLVPATKIGCMTSIHQFNGTASSMMKFIQTVFAFSLITVAAKLHTSDSIVSISLMFLLMLLIAIVLFKTLYSVNFSCRN